VRALLVTLEITLLGSVLALVVGLVVAVLRQARIPVLDQVRGAGGVHRDPRCWSRCSSCTSRCPGSASR